MVGPVNRLEAKGGRVRLDGLFFIDVVKHNDHNRKGHTGYARKPPDTRLGPMEKECYGVAMWQLPKTTRTDKRVKEEDVRLGFLLGDLSRSDVRSVEFASHHVCGCLSDRISKSVYTSPRTAPDIHGLSHHGAYLQA